MSNPDNSRRRLALRAWDSASRVQRRSASSVPGTRKKSAGAPVLSQLRRLARRRSLATRTSTRKWRTCRGAMRRRRDACSTPRSMARVPAASASGNWPKAFANSSVSMSNRLSRPWCRPRSGAGGDPRRTPHRLPQDPARHAAGDAHRREALPRTRLQRGAGLLPDAGRGHPVPRPGPRKLVRGADQQPDNLHHLFDFNRAWARHIREVDPGYFESSRTCRRRNTCGSAARIRACRPTRSSACCRARSSSIAMSPTSWCIPTSTASR
jgi:hypothetical protein